eukprot:TRINITY_DN20135_c0_g1_i1.p1 TRINITY_DN20135_c0_g1~~TRINITY_DN20135_c0_g1_i1.p1  ORF type:complete len:609 (-),score=135.43 TRINITY_DN20135_c0_g1_i1:89-1915(-)
MASANMDGTRRVYYEIFHATSNGDFGIQCKDGPLFRCHTHILKKVPGFLGKVRQFGQPLPRTVKDMGPHTCKDYFKAHGLTRMFEDATFVQFAQPTTFSTLRHLAAKSQASAEELEDRGKKKEPPKVPPADILMPGYSTSTLLSGDTGAVRRVDQFFLAERYCIDCDVERCCELLRYIYQGYTSYFDIKPRTDTERSELTHKMLGICKDAEKYSVDALFEKLLAWFGRESFWVIGEKNFASAFYHLQHFEMQCTEEHSRNSLIKTVTGDMLGSRHQFRAVTMDPRWAFLPVEFVEGTLSYDGMPISSEIEVLNLIDRWNAKTDKPKDQIVRLLGCFRPDDETRQTLETWLSGLGWLGADGRIADGMPELGPLRKILDGRAAKNKKPRRNLKGASLAAAEQAEAAQAAREAAEAEMTFIQYKGNRVVSKGSTFSLGAKQRLVQADPIRNSGIQQIRVVLSNPRKNLWDPEHQVFIGLSYGEGRYFGYLCSATAFSGIFSVRALASAAPAPNAPVHLTGSGNKVEFDIALEVQLQRVNLVVTCKLSIIFANETVTEELFQIASETLREGPGLRYQVVATNLKDEEVDVSLACVSGGGFDSTDEKGPSMMD